MTRRTAWEDRYNTGEEGGSESSAAREVPPTGSPEHARAVCLRLLSGAPRTRKQLADALRKRGIPTEVAEEVLSRFEEVGLIDDAAFATAWVESRHHSRGLARRSLARELRSRGVATSVVEEAVGQLDSAQEEQTARQLVERRMRTLQGVEERKRRRRLVAMLARRGYGEELALRVVRQVLAEHGSTTGEPEEDLSAW